MHERTAKREERKDHEKRALAERELSTERAPKSIPHENEKAAGDDGRKREEDNACKRIFAACKQHKEEGRAG